MNANDTINTEVSAIALGVFKIELTRQRKIFQTVEVDFDKLPESSKRYVIEYGLKQSLGDSHVSAPNDEEAIGLVNKRLDKILNGTMGTRSSSAEPSDPVEAEMLKMARNAVETKLRDKGFKLRGKNADVTPEKVAELIGQYVEKHGDKLRKVAEENIARAKALEEDEDDDILGDFVRQQNESNAGVVGDESNGSDESNGDTNGDDNGTDGDNGDGAEGEDHGDNESGEDGTPEGDDNPDEESTPDESGNKPRRRNRRK